MSLDKRWEIHDLNKIDLQGEDDVTKSVDTLANLFILIWSTILISPVSINSLFSLYFLSFLLILLLAWLLTKENSTQLLKHYTQNGNFNLNINLINIFNKYRKKFLLILKKSNFIQELKHINHLTHFFLLTLTLIILFKPQSELSNRLPIEYLIYIAVAALYSILQLISNRNFILYDLLYKYRLNIKLITIEENLSPFSPLITQFERIILGLNRNTNTKEEIDFSNSIIFFWIRKDKEIDRERSVKQFIPFISLITILFVLKEKSYKFVAVIGAYFATIGLLFITFYSFMIEQLIKNYGCNSAVISSITILALLAWYLLTIYNIYKLIDINRYLKRINSVSRRAKIKSDFNFSKGYQNLLDIFDRDNAMYIYDYIVDKYQYVNGDFLFKTLSQSKKFIDKNIGTLITIIISMVLVVMVEITANGIFQHCNTSDNNFTIIEKVGEKNV